MVAVSCITAILPASPPIAPQLSGPDCYHRVLGSPVSTITRNSGIAFITVELWLQGEGDAAFGLMSNDSAPIPHEARPRTATA